MTASPRLATSCLQAELSRLALDEWAFVRVRVQLLTEHSIS
jgi:hypothetical protein